MNAARGCNFEGGIPAEWVPDRISAIDAANWIDDLRVPPGIRLEALRGDRHDQHSDRINDHWRISITRWRARCAAPRPAGRGPCAMTAVRCIHADRCRDDRTGVLDMQRKL